MTFSPVNYTDLQKLVDGTVDAKIALKADFTAWDITQLVCAENPSVEVMHVVVRQIVHDGMAERMEHGLPYDFEQRDYSGQWAMTFFYDDGSNLPDDDDDVIVPTPPSGLWASISSIFSNN